MILPLGVFVLCLAFPLGANSDQEESALLKAIAEADVQRVAFVLDKGGDANERAADGRTALMLAAQGGSEPIVTLLLRSGADPNRSADGWTPLMAASAEGNNEIVALLLKAGARRWAKSKQGETPASLAISFGSIDVLRRLVSNPPSPSPMPDSGDLLDQAVRTGRLEFIDLLLEAGADPNAASDHHSPPLLTAVKSGEPGMVELLLRKGARGESADENGKTALMAAVETGQRSLVLPILAAGGDLNAQDIQGRSALSLAIEGGFSDLACQLLSAGARPQGHVGDRTLLTAAIDRDDGRAVGALIDAGADVAEADAAGDAPLALAIRKGSTGIAERLRGAGARE